MRRLLGLSKSSSLSLSSLLLGQCHPTIPSSTSFAAKWLQLSVKMGNVPNKALTRYVLLGVSLAGISSYGLYRYRSGNYEDNLRLGLLTAFSAGIGYLGHRYIRVAHCEADEGKFDNLDEALKVAADKVQDLKEVASERVQDMKEDLAEMVDKKADELFALAKEKYMTETLKEAFEFMQNILDNLKEFGGWEKEEFETPLIILLGMIKQAQNVLDEEWIKGLPKESMIEPEVFELHRRIGGFAMKVYDASWEEQLEGQAKTLGLENTSDLVFTYFKSKEDEHCPKFAIIRDEETRAVILAIRGTNSFTDIIIDLICDEEEFLDGYAHRGIMRGTKEVIEMAGPILKKTLGQNRDYQLFVTGHSLGAGTAQLATMELILNKPKYLPRGTKVHCVALAPPPVYRSDTPVPEDISKALDIYINSQDCIPRTCLGSVARLVAMVRAVDKIKMSNYEKLKVIAGMTDNETLRNLAKITQVIVDIRQDRFPFLEHPGQIHYLYKYRDLTPGGDDSVAWLADKRKVLVVTEKSQSFTRELILLERMVLDHLQDCYKSVLDKAYVKDKKKP